MMILWNMTGNMLDNTAYVLTDDELLEVVKALIAIKNEATDIPRLLESNIVIRPVIVTEEEYENVPYFAGGK